MHTLEMTQTKTHGQARPRRQRFRRRTQPGAVPGVIVVDPDAPTPRIIVTSYGNRDGDIERQDAARLEDIARMRGLRSVLWVDVTGLGDANIIQGIGKIFDLHPLALEDVVNVHQAVKVDDYGDHLYLAARIAAHAGKHGTEQVSIFLGKDYVVTFGESEGEWSSALRNRLDERHSYLRTRGADFLAYAVVDALIDSYFPILEHYGERLDTIEDQLTQDPPHGIMHDVHEIRSALRALRRAVWPYRDVVNSLLHDPTPLVGDETRMFLRDCLDHAVQLVDLLEIYRETCADMRDVYLSTVNYRLNQIMTVLTVIATIFIPLSFIASLYGMNFNTRTSPWNMPELNWTFGYPFALGLMGVVTLALLAYLRVKGWVGSRSGGNEHGGRGERPDASRYDTHRPSDVRPG